MATAEAEQTWCAILLVEDPLLDGIVATTGHEHRLAGKEVEGDNLRERGRGDQCVSHRGKRRNGS